jgi:lipid A 3-O-deacylase
LISHPRVFHGLPGHDIAGLIVMTILLAAACSGHAQTSRASAGGLNDRTNSVLLSIWRDDIPGRGLRAGVQQVGVSLASGFSATGRQHDLALAMFRYGRVMTDVVGADHFYRGNVELGAEVFAGGQYSPEAAYLFGAAPTVRYDFATGTRWVPFLEVGFGFASTDIKGDDLSTTYEFKSEGGAGVHYFWRGNVSAFFEYQFFHLSNGGFHKPNRGTNINLFSLGLAVFF